MKFMAEISDNNEARLAKVEADSIQDLAESIGSELQGIYEFDAEAAAVLSIRLDAPF